MEFPAQPHRSGSIGIDLHAHTTASDGELSPAQLIAEAKRINLAALAITDHDTVAGAVEACGTLTDALVVVPGIEMAARNAFGRCDILGLFIDPYSGALQSSLASRRAWRTERAQSMVKRLNRAGVPLSMEAVNTCAGSAAIGRPHVARALVEGGFATDISHAFSKYLAEGRSGYIPSAQLTTAEVISTIHAAGGVAVLAHPARIGLGEHAICEAAEALRTEGLDALECWYSTHTDAETHSLLALARRLGLLVTGGSDFHGPHVKPEIKLGHVTGRRAAPVELYAPLRARASVHRTAFAEGR
ncbi:MAG: PHP domain-containing protein [Armatimonadetes bacterium]|nr:PHP domain-containing protein [Armatimonadota bacterium]MDE2205566.1 PHP domain-containing protein [Armatimonadota bacterium]